MADFGYSTLAAANTGSVLLPKSRPWNAPEHHFTEFQVSEAKKTDVYSFGMLCLWVLLGAVQDQHYTAKFTFDISNGPRTPLEQLKDDDELEHFANQLLDSAPLVGLDVKQRACLNEFFSLTVKLNPESRSSDLE
jgi:hypothetical protein